MIDVLVEDDRWDGPGIQDLAPRGATATLTHLGMSPEEWEISVLACDDSRIAALNAEFRRKPTATNVLSWPSVDRAPDAPGRVPELPDPTEGGELGDIAISFDTCTQEAKSAGIPLEQHASHLMVHAVLHLLGYDHENDEDAALMQRIETEILATMGYPDPYYGSGSD